ncbi:MAG: cytidine deaminase, partial [Eubacteriales bacterium]|nr:cytidine deaminase [Eubacteriales bacterium]
DRYELCRSVHAEANAIISAARRDMIGGTLYLVGREAESRAFVKGATPCSMCRRLIINAGIEKVIARESEDTYTVTMVNEWVLKDDTAELKP